MTMAQIPKKYEHLTVEDATHRLSCSHCPNGSDQPCIDYTMPCIPLESLEGKVWVRVLVFGERYWKDRYHKRRIRKVQTWKLQKID